MFGLNNAQLIGRLGADVTVNNLKKSQRRRKVANLSIATDESYIDKQTGERVDRTEWHRVVTFQAGLVEMFERHARKGRLVYVAGKLQTRRWKKDGEDSDRFSTEIMDPGPRWPRAIPRQGHWLERQRRTRDDGRRRRDPDAGQGRQPLDRDRRTRAGRPHRVPF